MKLDWEIEYGLLKAAVGDAEYRVRQESDGAWQANKKTELPRGCAIARCSIEGPLGTSSLTNAIAWCEKDAERPAECPAQPPAAKPNPEKMPGEMSGTASKFPGTLDAHSWASAYEFEEPLMRAGDGARLWPWFQAALSLGFREGREDQKELHACFQPYRLKDPPPPKPGWQASFDARDWAKEFMRCNHQVAGNPMVAVDEETMVGWFANALMRGYDEHRWKTERESPPTGPSDLERLETTVRLHREWAAKNIGDLRETLQMRTDGLDGPAPKASRDRAEDHIHRLKSVVAQLKIDFLRGLKTANERIGVLESKSGGDWSKRLSDLETKVPPLPPSAEARIAKLEERAHQQGWQVKENTKHYENVDDAVGNLESRVEELERKAAVAAEANHLFHHAIEGRVFQLERRYATADEARKPCP